MNTSSWPPPTPAGFAERTPKFKFGDTVKYYQYNELQDGIITYCFLNGRVDFCYHVRDPDGRYWHRGEQELKNVD